MKTITTTTNLYQFNELSETAKSKAIEQYREIMYNNPDISRWVIDDCYLFEPLNIDLENLFGEQYRKLDKPIIGNTRNVYFDTGRNSFLDAGKGIKINNEKMFLLWLGIPESIHDAVYFRIKNTTTRYPDTIIKFEENDTEYQFSDEENEILEKAADKFSDHMHSTLGRISDGIEYYYSDDYIVETLDDMEYEFTEDGAIY
jgi:hypothetical protein